MDFTLGLVLGVNQVGPESVISAFVHRDNEQLEAVCRRELGRVDLSIDQLPD